MVTILTPALTAFYEVDTQLIKFLGNLELIHHREGYTFPLCPIPKGSIIKLDWWQFLASYLPGNQIPHLLRPHLLFTFLHYIVGTIASS